MKLIQLELHKYAPELNTAVFAKGKKEYRFRVPGVVRMSDVRRTLFGFKRCLLATVTKTYADNPSLNRTAWGVVSNRAEAIACAREWRSKLAPGGVVSISVQMRG